MVRWYYSDPQRLGEVEALVIEENVVAWAEKQMKIVTTPKSFDEVMEIKR
jgi:trigger factor